MNLTRNIIAACLAAVALTFTAVPAAAAPRIQGTIAVSDDASETELAAVAKISAQEAAAAALKAQAGTVVKVELDEEDLFAVWEVEVVTAEKKKVKVIIDAGNGSVLHPK